MLPKMRPSRCTMAVREIQEAPMRKKLLQNTLFAAMTAWAVYGLQAHVDAAIADAGVASTMVAMQR